MPMFYFWLAMSLVLLVLVIFLADLPFERYCQSQQWKDDYGRDTEIKKRASA